ncbi:MAG: outer membrane lipoprotein-sorting protein [Myxococcales bacterium]|nr:outer membrane lipoprotein-sorting protein [Myxococcales bacterium]
MNRVHASLSRRILIAVSSLVIAVAFAASAHADGNESLAKVDKTVNAWKTIDYHFEVTTKSGATTTVLKLRTRARNRGTYNKQLIVISEPADMAGTKVLSTKPTKMYIYLPAFKKIRRIASHVNEQGFLGTALSSKDLDLTHYGVYFNATELADAGGKVKLALTAKDETAPYPKLEMDVDKSKWVPSEIRYLNEAGKVLKTETRSDYFCEGDYCVPKTMLMVDHTKNVSSRMLLAEHKINPKLDKGLFSKRNLN